MSGGLSCGVDLERGLLVLLAPLPNLPLYRSSTDRAASKAPPAQANAVSGSVSALETVTGGGDNVSLDDLKPEDVRVLLNMANNQKQDRLLGAAATSTGSGDRSHPATNTGIHNQVATGSAAPARVPTAASGSLLPLTALAGSSSPSGGGAGSTSPRTAAAGSSDASGGEAVAGNLGGGTPIVDLDRALIILMVISMDNIAIMAQQGNSNQTTNSTRLRIAVPVKNGFTELADVKRDPTTGEYIFKGYTIDIFKNVINSAMPYNVSFDFIPFAMPNGSMNDTYDDML
uniref:Uncharacterized protein n=1 Tax=Chenopodium quinoa TaxID=63459 RepID=A0A803M6X3_CHEQI